MCCERPEIICSIIQTSSFRVFTVIRATVTRRWHHQHQALMQPTSHTSHTRSKRSWWGPVKLARIHQVSKSSLRYTLPLSQHAGNCFGNLLPLSDTAAREMIDIFDISEDTIQLVQTSLTTSQYGNFDHQRAERKLP